MHFFFFLVLALIQLCCQKLPDTAMCSAKQPAFSFQRNLAKLIFHRKIQLKIPQDERCDEAAVDGPGRDEGRGGVRRLHGGDAAAGGEGGQGGHAEHEGQHRECLILVIMNLCIALGCVTSLTLIYIGMIFFKTEVREWQFNPS